MRTMPASSPNYHYPHHAQTAIEQSHQLAHELPQSPYLHNHHFLIDHKQERNGLLSMQELLLQQQQHNYAQEQQQPYHHSEQQEHQKNKSHPSQLPVEAIAGSDIHPKSIMTSHGVTVCNANSGSMVASHSMSGCDANQLSRMACYGNANTGNIIMPSHLLAPLGMPSLKRGNPISEKALSPNKKACSEYAGQHGSNSSLGNPGCEQLQSELRHQHCKQKQQLQQKEGEKSGKKQIKSTCSFPKANSQQQLLVSTSKRGARRLDISTHFVTERQRREFLNEKYQSLRSLIPCPTKMDRASIVQDAIDHVKELKKRVQHLLHIKALGKAVASKRRSVCVDFALSDMPKNEDGRLDFPETEKFITEIECIDSKLSSSSVRSSDHGTLVDVRIMGDEATIKLTQHQVPNSLLNAVLVLHQLQVELLHASGAKMEDYNVYILYAKIPKGMTIYASKLAMNLLDGLDKDVSQQTILSPLEALH